MKNKYIYKGTSTGRIVGPANMIEIERLPKPERPIFIPADHPVLIEVDLSVFDLVPRIKITKA